MASVELSIPPDAAHVRTARQVAVAVARLSGMSDETLESVRLAVGEASGLMLRLGDGHDGDAQIKLEIRDDDGLAVAIAVSAETPLAEATGPEAAEHLISLDASRPSPEPEPLPIGAVLALLDELATEVDVTAGPQGIRLELRWAPARV